MNGNSTKLTQTDFHNDRIAFLKYEVMAVAIILIVEIVIKCNNIMNAREGKLKTANKTLVILMVFKTIRIFIIIIFY